LQVPGLASSNGDDVLKRYILLTLALSALRPSCLHLLPICITRLQLRLIYDPLTQSPS
ncbi:hypothetical protein BX616_010834, partial [Lobosporangium transversale]